MTITEAARRSNSHTCGLNKVGEMYVETMVTCIWTAAILSEQEYSHLFLEARAVEKIIEATSLLDPELFEIHYDELSQVMCYLFHTIAFNLDSCCE